MSSGEPPRQLAVIGPGKLGQTLSRLAVAAGWRLTAVVGRRVEPAQGTAALVPAAAPGQPAVGTVADLAVGRPLTDAVAAAGWLLIATSDDAIAEVAERLAAAIGPQPRPQVQPARVAFHASGALAADVLAPLRACGYALGSLHPLRSFAEPGQAAAAFAGTPCAVEGEPAATAALAEFARALGGEPFGLPAAGKVLYHAAAVVACNYLVALEDTAADLMAAATGLSREQALRRLLPIVHGTVDLLARVGSPAALTGPIQRGDAATVRRHLDALRAAAPQALPLYRLLGRQTVAVAQAKGLAPGAAAAMRRLLAEPEPEPRSGTEPPSAAETGQISDPPPKNPNTGG